MTTGHFRQQKARLVEQRIQLFFFRWLLPCQYFLDNWTLLSFSLLGVYIDQSSSSQIHPKCSLGQDSPKTCEMRQDSPKVWSEPSFETSTTTLQSSFKASLSRCVGLGMRESLILRTHLARESISGIRKARDTLDKVPDWQAANFDSENVSSNRGIFERKKTKQSGERGRK